MNKKHLDNDISYLIESSKIINSSLNLSKILNKVTSISKELLRAETGSLMLLDDNTNNLVFAVALGNKGFKLKKGVKIKLGHGIAGTVAKTKKPVLIKNVRKDKRFSDWVDRFSGFKTKSIMCVPLLIDNKVIGVLEAVNSLRKKGFSKKDMDLFQAFACQVAVAIDNAKLHKDELDIQRFNQELEIARQLQQNLLPKPPEFQNIKINAKNIPAEQVGGDLYDFFDLGNGIIGIMISDVSGKGIPAALYMARLMSELRFAVQSKKEPGLALKHLNSILIKNSIMGMFVTLFYLVIDTVNKKIIYSSAGHLPPIHHSRKSNTLEYLDKAQNPPLGINPETEFKTIEMGYNDDSAILLYTDGITEAKNSLGEQYSVKRLKEIFSNNADGNTIEVINNAVTDFTGNARHSDDRTLVSIRF